MSLPTEAPSSQLQGNWKQAFIRVRAGKPTSGGWIFPLTIGFPLQFSGEGSPPMHARMAQSCISLQGLTDNVRATADSGKALRSLHTTQSGEGTKDSV